MAERKVQSKHMPSDFDPRLLQALNKKERNRNKKKKNDASSSNSNKETVRIMLPFNVCCSTCNSYMYRGRKFNGKKEEGVDQNYLGTKVLRFHIKCETCSAPIVFRTDPKIAGFLMVSGARESKTTAGTFNPLTDVVEKDEQPQDGLDAVAALEARALETKKEQQVIQELEQELERSKARSAAALKAAQVVKSGHSGVDAHQGDSSQSEMNEEEQQALAAFREKKRMLDFQSSSSLGVGLGSTNTSSNDSGLTIQRAAKKKKVMTSLVPYADSDEDED